MNKICDNCFTDEFGFGCTLIIRIGHINSISYFLEFFLCSFVVNVHFITKTEKIVKYLKIRAVELSYI